MLSSKKLYFSKTGKWKFYWENNPLPEGSEVLGTVTRGDFDTGALIRLATGEYVQGNAGLTRAVDQKTVKALVTAALESEKVLTKAGVADPEVQKGHAAKRWPALKWASTQKTHKRAH